MSNEYGYVGAEVAQSFKNNRGIFSPQDILELDQANKWTNFGQLELIETITASSATQIDFLNLNDKFGATYNYHYLTGSNISVSLDSGRITGRFFESGVLNSSSDYEFAFKQTNSNVSSSDTKSTSDNKLKIGTTQGNSAVTDLGAFQGWFANLNASHLYSYYNGTTIGLSGCVIRTDVGGSFLDQASFITGIRLFAHHSSSITMNGVFSLYGLRTFS